MCQTFYGTVQNYQIFHEQQKKETPPGAFLPILYSSVHNIFDPVLDKVILMTFCCQVSPNAPYFSTETKLSERIAALNELLISSAPSGQRAARWSVNRNRLHHLLRFTSRFPPAAYIINLSGNVGGENKGSQSVYPSGASH